MKLTNIYSYLKLSIIFCTTLFGVATFAQGNGGFVIKGELKGLKDGSKIYLVHSTRNFDVKSYDSLEAIVQEEKFIFKGKVQKEAQFYTLRIENNSKGRSILLTNDLVIVNGSVQNWPDVKVTGARYNDDRVNFSKIYNPILGRKDSLFKLLRLTNIAEEKAEIRNRLEVVRSEINKVWESYINDNPSSYYTPFLIIQAVMSYEQKLMAYSKLTKNAQLSYYGLELKEKLRILEISSKVKIGNIAPDFSSLTLDGEPFSLLKEVSKNKLTLIDFWASWCRPCRDAMPNIKKVYESFHKKGFNVIGVSLDSDRKAWLNAIEEEKIPWLQVSQLKGRNEEAARFYSINGVPAYLLIDGEGKVVAVDLPASDIPNAGGNIRGKLFNTVENFFNKTTKE